MYQYGALLERSKSAYIHAPPYDCAHAVPQILVTFVAIVRKLQEEFANRPIQLY